MAGKMQSLPMRLASAWAPGLALADPAAARRLERVATFGLYGMMVAPAALCLGTSPAVALPVGVGGVAALTLVAAAWFASGTRQTAAAAEAAQDDTLARYQQDPLLDLLPGLVTLHNERGLVTRVSGRDRAALMGDLRALDAKGFLDQIHVSDRILFLQAVDAMRQGGKGSAINLRFETRSAEEDARSQFVHRRLMLSAFFTPFGDFAGFLSQMLDNAEEVAMTRALSAKVEDAETANEAKTRFLAAVSHELRTPLNAILGFSDILAGEYFGKLENDRQREYVGLINQSGNHLLALVNTMLDMSKIEAGRYELQCEDFAASEAVSTCERMLALQAKNKGVTLTTRIARDAGDLVADRRAVQQVLINLVGNALKFTDAGGVVSLDVERRGGELVFTVSDTGIGIPQDKIALLGRPFMQVQGEYARKYEGTGLGLSLVKGLVELHGGRVVIESRLGEGTVVSVSFPEAGPQVARGQILEPASTETSQVVALDTRPEFPPRLPVAGKSMNDKKENAHDHAKAQTA
ncbi:sensor histidine kinase [Rhizobium sp. C1]|uniref:sensor histidine kinase n=1 Tax=Rhizobium sp. C1 TaxID=1349799 RepID=UPI001E55B2FA|nr:HAMP domain-containing sensor histidine kinase [Rhizobium sp. C1]MCD2177449.1 HAMP domain-containing histidine kinase [Rhizobium sp. C1]